MCAIKIAPFNRYHTLDVVRAVAQSGREIALLYRQRRQHRDRSGHALPLPINGKPKELRIVGGLLGHWAVWTKSAVNLLTEMPRLGARRSAGPAIPDGESRPRDRLQCAFFDTANEFAGVYRWFA